MSTVRAENFGNAGGTSKIPVNTLLQGTAKAWLNLNGTGTIAARDSFNVSSVVDSGVGQYQSLYSVAQPNSNGSGHVTASGTANWPGGNISIAIGSAGIFVWNDTAAAIAFSDANVVMFSALGDPAL